MLTLAGTPAVIFIQYFTPGWICDVLYLCQKLWECQELWAAICYKSLEIIKTLVLMNTNLVPQKGSQLAGGSVRAGVAPSPATAERCFFKFSPVSHMGPEMIMTIFGLNLCRYKLYECPSNATILIFIRTTELTRKEGEFLYIHHVKSGSGNIYIFTIVECVCIQKIRLA